jgi:hydrogenase nickel incorporation protein HypA/HybF
MHELAITQSMLDIVLGEAGKSGMDRVNRINLVVGELSGYVTDSIQFYFDFLAKDSIAEGAELCFILIEARARCRRCETDFKLPEFDWNCPQCGSGDIEITAGRELRVESIEAD